MYQQAVVKGIAEAGEGAAHGGLAHVGNDPWNGRDPSGLDDWDEPEPPKVKVGAVVSVPTPAERKLLLRKIQTAWFGDLSTAICPFLTPETSAFAITWQRFRSASTQSTLWPMTPPLGRAVSTEPRG